MSIGFGGRDGQVENIMRYLNLGYGLCNNPGNAMYFKIDPQWYRNYSDSVEILVTYKDANESTWQVEYDDLNSGRQASPAIITSMADEWKTVTFTLEGLKAAGSFSESFQCPDNDSYSVIAGWACKSRYL